MLWVCWERAGKMLGSCLEHGVACCGHARSVLWACWSVVERGVEHAGSMVKHVVGMLGMYWSMPEVYRSVLVACWSILGAWWSTLGPCRERAVGMLECVGGLLGAWWKHGGSVLESARSVLGARWERSGSMTERAGSVLGA